MNPISARSRRPAWVLTSMLSTSCRASSGASTGVLPRFTTVGTTPDLSSGLDGLVGPLPTHAPAPLPEGTRFETLTYTNAAGSRAYKLYIPSGYSGQPVPLVVMLHGYTQSPDDFAAGTKMNALAEEQIFLVAYPGQTASANHGKCWNWFKPGDQQRDQGGPSILAGLTAIRSLPNQRQERICVQR